jgi:hypothetical protein
MYNSKLSALNRSKTNEKLKFYAKKIGIQIIKEGNRI